MPAAAVGSVLMIVPLLLGRPCLYFTSQSFFFASLSTTAGQPHGFGGVSQSLAWYSHRWPLSVSLIGAVRLPAGCEQGMPELPSLLMVQQPQIGLAAMPR